jgi:hypothetical protein
LGISVVVAWYWELVMGDGFTFAIESVEGVVWNSRLVTTVVVAWRWELVTGDRLTFAIKGSAGEF